MRQITLTPGEDPAVSTVLCADRGVQLRYAAVAADSFDGTTIAMPSYGSSTPYAHLITEVGESDAITIDEPDGLMLVRVWRDANDAGDTYPDVAFAFTADLHYQSDRNGTPNKRPDFYTK